MIDILAMFQIFILYALIFLIFATPISLIIIFAIRLYRYISAKKQNKITPGTFSDEEMQGRKSVLILLGILAVIALIFLIIVSGIYILLTMAVAYM